MIIYATKQTVERYGLKMPEDLQNPIMREIALEVYDQEKGNRMLEWGAKVFYYDRRKCLQVCNFASKLIVVLVDIRKANLEVVGELIARYLMEIYSEDKKMKDLLVRFFKEYPMVCFSKISDRSTISTMNRFQREYLWDGYRLNEYIENNVLNTIKLNKDINNNYIVSGKVDGKQRYFLPAERFAELLNEYYSQPERHLVK